MARRATRIRSSICNDRGPMPVRRHSCYTTSAIFARRKNARKSSKRPVFQHLSSPSPHRPCNTASFCPRPTTHIIIPAETACLKAFSWPGPRMQRASYTPWCVAIAELLRSLPSLAPRFLVPMLRVGTHSARRSASLGWDRPRPGPLAATRDAERPRLPLRRGAS